jgi:HD-GYP domain-containing protein (c-di-GMP phosphodiesterase class II)
MTSERPYQPPLPTITALDEIERCAGNQFDPDVTASLQRVFDHDRLRALHRMRPRPEKKASGPADPFSSSPTLVQLRHR